MPNYAFFRHKGHRWLIPHWIPVGEDVTYENLREHIPPEYQWILNSNPFAPVRPQVERYPVPNRPYTISVSGDEISCDCPGYRWRSKCKHTTAFKEKPE